MDICTEIRYSYILLFDYTTIEELLQFMESVKKAFDIARPLTLTNRYS